jgi:hypothetical protein
MSKRHALFTALAAVHLGLVVCGALGWGLLPEDKLTGQVLRVGQAMSGSDTGYGFFAPDVGADLRARFTMIDATGREWTDDMSFGNNLEARLRVANVLALVYDEELRGVAAGSLAGTMFGRHPTAQTVIVTIETYDPPTMEEYREGDRPEWEVVYEAAISRKPKTSAQAER